MKYINNITGESTDYPYRIKTEEEFIKDFGNRWYYTVAWDVSMRFLLGQDFKDSTNSTDKNEIDRLFEETPRIYGGVKYLLTNNMEWNISKDMLTENISFANVYNKKNRLVYENNIIKFKNFRNGI